MKKMCNQVANTVCVVCYLLSKFLGAAKCQTLSKQREFVKKKFLQVLEDCGANVT